MDGDDCEGSEDGVSDSRRCFETILKKRTIGLLFTSCRGLCLNGIFSRELWKRRDRDGRLVVGRGGGGIGFL